MSGAPTTLSRPLKRLIGVLAWLIGASVWTAIIIPIKVYEFFSYLVWKHRQVKP